MTGESTYTLENLMEFYRIAATRMGARSRIIRPLYFLAGTVLVLIGLFQGLGVLQGDGDLVAIALAAISLYLGAQLLHIGWRFYNGFAARALKSIPENAQHCYFSFEDEQLVISNRLKSVSYPYEQFGVIYETEQRFHFYISTYNGYILEKSGIHDGTAEELRSFLNSRREDPVQQISLS